jgi:hypothetical protein
MVDLEQFLRNLGYGAVDLPARFGQWVARKWNPTDPEFPKARQALLQALQQAREEAKAFGPAPSGPIVSTGISGPPPGWPVAHLDGPNVVVSFQPFTLTARVDGGTPPYTINPDFPADFVNPGQQIGYGPWKFTGLLQLPSLDGYVFWIRGTDAVGRTFGAQHRVIVPV